MASGDFAAGGRFGQLFKLIDAVSATSDGVWIDATMLQHGSIEVTIATTATVQLRGSNAASKPANSADGFQIGSDITASGGFAIEHLPRFLKAKISAHTSGAVSVLAWLRPVVTGA